MTVELSEEVEPSFPTVRAAFAGRGMGDLLRVLAGATASSVFFFAVYTACNVITARRTDVGHAAFGWERHIPFVPVMIVPYMSIDLFFFIALFVCRSRLERVNHARRIFLAITLAGICFLLFPLTMSLTRPPPAGPFAPIFKFLYGFDKPYNLAPSLHITLRTLLWVVYIPNTRGIVRAAIKVWFILIGISTVLTYQHQFIDLVTGQFLGLFCLHIFPPNSDGFRVRNRRIGIRYALGAMAFFTIAYLLRPWGLLLIWPGASLAILAWTYLAAGPAVFRKRNGRLPLSTHVVLWPYLVIVRLVLIWHKQREMQFSEVVPGVLIGQQLNRREAAVLVKDGVTAALDLTAEFTETYPLRSISYLSIPILDLTPPSKDQLGTAVAFLREHAGHGRVYVHCAWGYSRSACVVAAYLLATGQVGSVREAISKIEAVRPHIIMDDTHVKALQMFLEGLKCSCQTSVDVDHGTGDRCDLVFE